MSNFRSALLTFLIISIGSINTSNAGGSTSNFIDVSATNVSTPADKKAIDIRRQDPSIDWVVPIRINLEALKADSFSAFLYDRHIVIHKDAVQRHDPQFPRVWRGYVLLPGDTTDEQNSGLRSVRISPRPDGKMRGTIRIDQLVYEINSLPSGRHILIKQDISRLPTEGSDDAFPNPELKSGRMHGAGDGAGQMDTIRIVIGFTPAADGGDYEAFIEAAGNAVDDANESFADSGILLTLEIAAYARPNYSETSLLQTWNDLRQGSQGPLWLVNLARNKEFADVAAMVIETPADPYCGRAPVGSTVETALLVVQRRCFRVHTLAHELGHLLSANHNPEDIGLPSPFAYGHGYRYLRAGRLDRSWSTVMSAVDGPNGAEYARLNRWSTPLQLYNGRAMGTSETHDNARVLRETKSIVADFYPDPAPDSPQALIPAKEIKIYTPQGVHYLVDSGRD